jgi:hypothetical protein
LKSQPALEYKILSRWKKQEDLALLDAVEEYGRDLAKRIFWLKDWKGQI